MKFAEMTFPQLRQVPRDRSIVLAPIAACEQHSRHLPTLTDTVLVTAVADAAAFVDRWPVETIQAVEPEALAELLREFLRQRARHDVVRAACAVRRDDAQGAVGVVFRGTRGRCPCAREEEDHA